MRDAKASRPSNFGSNGTARMCGIEQTPAAGRAKLGIDIQEAALSTSLTPQQISILRRLNDGLGLPAHALRPRHCAQDVELLLFFRLIASGRRGLSIEPSGTAYLARLDSTEPPGSHEQLVAPRVAHGRDRSISGEHRHEEEAGLAATAWARAPMPQQAET